MWANSKVTIKFGPYLYVYEHIYLHFFVSSLPPFQAEQNNEMRHREKASIFDNCNWMKWYSMATSRKWISVKYECVFSFERTISRDADWLIQYLHVIQNIHFILLLYFMWKWKQFLRLHKIWLGQWVVLFPSNNINTKMAISFHIYVA